MKEQFQKGQEVQVRGPDEWENAIYIAYIGDVVQTYYPHIVLLDGSTFQARGYALCQPRLPDLKLNDPVWVRSQCSLFCPANFAGWAENGDMLVWTYGRTSHTACSEDDIYQYPYGYYRTTPPEEE